jgi:NitT/TauT family transport system substrate-binding protein
LQLLLLSTLTLGITAIGHAKDYGKPGEPINLVVGYQPYYTEAWSGVVMRGKEFWRKYLPEGSNVEFQIGLQGSIIVNAMLAGKQDIGYMGDMPAIVATTKERVSDVRIVGVSGLAWDQCNIFLVRSDAPEFGDSKEALQWLNGKRVAAPKGACADRYVEVVFQTENIKPAGYLNQNIEVITSGFKAGKLDAASIWEPTASKLVDEGLARRVASGYSVGENDGAFITMRADLIEQRPDVVNGWLNAELDAQLFMADPANALEVAALAEAQTTGFSQKQLWMSFTGAYSPEQDGGSERLLLEFGFTDRTNELISRAAKFLHGIKAIHVETLRPEAVMPEFTEEILQERGLEAPIGTVEAQPASSFPG